MPKIELKNLDKVLNKLEFLPVLTQGLEAAGLWVKNFMADYPPQRRGPQPFKTEKSKRFFFWAIAHGERDFPYRRGMSGKSQSLADAWTVEVQPSGREVIVGNDTSYGPWVQDEDKPQSYFHKQTGWPTKQEVIRSKGDYVMGEILKKIEQHIKS